MPCKQIAPTGNKRPPFRAPFATEAECNQACQEGACCEGTTCSVTPACQCQGTGKTFKGVGTTCSPNTCKRCTESGVPKETTTARCHCFCGELGYPRFINVSLSMNYVVGRLVYQPSSFGWSYYGGVEYKQKPLSASVTLTISPQSAIAQPWVPVTDNPPQFQTDCPRWTYGGASVSDFLPLGGSAATGRLQLETLYLTSTSVQWYLYLAVRDVSEWTSAIDANGKSGWGTGLAQTNNGIEPTLVAVQGPSATQTGGPYSSAPCFSAFSGTVLSDVQQTVVGAFSNISISISGVQQ